MGTRQECLAGKEVSRLLVFAYKCLKWWWAAGGKKGGGRNSQWCDGDLNKTCLLLTGQNKGDEGDDGPPFLDLFGVEIYGRAAVATAPSSAQERRDYHRG